MLYCVCQYNVLFRAFHTSISSSVASGFLSWIVLLKSKILSFYERGRRVFSSLALLDILAFLRGIFWRPSVHPFVCPFVSARRL